MDSLSGYANRPFPFVLRYLRQRLSSHIVIVLSVIAAVACSVGTQYGVKSVVDGLTAGASHAGSVWLAFILLMSLIAADNFLWRIASWTASFTFVGVTGDLRRDIFRHLTGHAPSYFSDRLPGMLTSRITATSNAVYTVENMFVWNVLPPCMATIAAIALIGTVSLPMAAGLIVIAGIMVVAMFRLAAAGKPLHDDFANKAAAVDGEMVDVINNMPLVRAFCGLRYEHDRFDATVEPGTHGARAQPALSGKAAAAARRHYGCVDDRACWPGPSCCGSAAAPPPATSCWSARSGFPSSARRAISRWRWSTSPSMSPA